MAEEEARDRLVTDLRKQAKADKRAAKKAKAKRGGSKDASEAANDSLLGSKKADNFKVDVKDDRFAALFEGNANFGIDMTSTEYKDTAGVQQILSEQRKRREEHSKTNGGEKAAKKAKTAPTGSDESRKGTSDVQSLASKLKNKFAGKK